MLGQVSSVYARLGQVRSG